MKTLWGNVHVHSSCLNNDLYGKSWASFYDTICREIFFFLKSAKKLLLVWKLPKVVKFKFVRIVLVDLPGYWGNNDRCKQIRC